MPTTTQYLARSARYLCASCLHYKWQQELNSQTQNNLQQFYPIIPAQSVDPPSFQRRDQIMYNRLRIWDTLVQPIFVLLITRL